MSWSALAFFTGLFGSLHCVAMCGPLLMAMPFAGRSVWFAILQRVLYQAGRILVYVSFGFFFGLIGQNFNLLGWQQNISIITGCILIVLAFFHFGNKKFSALERFQLKLITPFSKQLGRMLIKPYGGFFAGMLNGFLPCGMVYLALAGAINSNSVMAGGQFMFFFGLGTTPLMLMAALAGMYFRKWTRIYFSRILPYLTICLGLWFILRGADLGIPYLSPIIQVSTPPVCK